MRIKVNEFRTLLQIDGIPTAFGFMVTSLEEYRKPPLIWRQRTDKALVEEETRPRFSVDIYGNSRAEGTGRVLGSTARLCNSTDTDCPDTSEASLGGPAPISPLDIQDAFIRTTLTKAASAGFQWIFGINADDFPDGGIQLVFSNNRSRPEVSQQPDDQSYGV